MNSALLQLGLKTTVVARSFSVSTNLNKSHSCKLLVVGGGSGGCTIANKFAKHFKTKDSIIILEPSSHHYYQPLWTLVGAGVTNLAESHQDMRSVLPADHKWIQQAAAQIDPENNKVTTTDNTVINYEYLVIAVGLNNAYEKIPGLQDALKDLRFGVATVYDNKYVENVFKLLQGLNNGEAVFTFPDTPIKCPGAPQKIAYLADSLLTKKGVRSNVNISYTTALPVLFGVKKYADELLKVAERKKINIGYKRVLKEIHPERKEAVFQVTSGDGASPCTSAMRYDFLHVSPPMETPDFIRSESKLVDSTGYLDVDKFTLQHVRYPNIYGIGDCTNTPNSKTVAAIAKQCYVLEKNLLKTMLKHPASRLTDEAQKYDGYGACPLVTSFNTCILAEFIYGGIPHETMPFNQAKESVIAYHMKRRLFPFLYWNFFLKGNYHGPEFVRRIINPFGWN